MSHWITPWKAILVAAVLAAGYLIFKWRIDVPEVGQTTTSYYAAPPIVPMSSIVPPGPNTPTASSDLDRVEGKPDPAMPASVQIWEKLRLMDTKGRGPIPDKVKGLLGKKVQVAGFLILNEVEGEYLKEFLLTPIPGGCIHVPPPPPNFIVHVNMKDSKKVKIGFKPIVVEGVLTANSDSKSKRMYSYEMLGEAVTDYKY